MKFRDRGTQRKGDTEKGRHRDRETQKWKKHGQGVTEPESSKENPRLYAGVLFIHT